MQNISKVIMAAVLAASMMISDASAASLLGGLIKTGGDSGNGDGIISTNDGSIGALGPNGVSVNLGGLGGGGTGGSGGGTQVGLPGVAEVSFNQGSGGTQAGVSLLGGGNDISINPGGLLGGSGGLTLGLPRFGGTSGGPGTPGAPGSNGVGGLNGFNGANGFNGFNGVDGRNGVFIGNVSGRLRTILAMLAARDWIRLVNGRAICLSNFGTAEVSRVVPQNDWPRFNAALPQYAQDIATLRQLLANCRSTQMRQALVNRVIGLDIDRRGMPVLYLL